jgi:hypothetical protein
MLFENLLIAVTSPQQSKPGSADWRRPACRLHILLDKKSSDRNVVTRLSELEKEHPSGNEKRATGSLAE